MRRWVSRGAVAAADDSDDASVLACLRTDGASWTDRRTPELLTEKLRLVAGILRNTPPGSVALGRLVESGNDAENIDRLNLGAIPTTRLNWLQPHEGNIVDFLFRSRAFQMA